MSSNLIKSKVHFSFNGTQVHKKRMINTLIGAIVLILLITLCYAISWDNLIPQMFGYMKGTDA